MLGGKKKVNYAIVGTSFISTVMIEAIRKSEHGHVYCVYNRSLEKLKEYCKKHDIGVEYSDFELLLEDSNVDVVYIGLPGYLHGSWTQKCAKCKKHILCEKTFTIDFEEAVKTFEIVSQNNVFCMEAQMYRCHPIIPKLYEIVKQKPLGQIQSVESIFTAPIIELFNKKAGGAILDLGCYPISLTRYLFGEIDVHNIFAEGTKSHIVQSEHPSENNYDVESDIELKLDNGISVNIHVANNKELNWVYNIHCEHGTMSLSNMWDESTPAVIALLHKTVYRGNANNAIKNSISDNDIIKKEEINIPIPGDDCFYTMQINTVNDHICRGNVQAGTNNIECIISQKLGSFGGDISCIDVYASNIGYVNTNDTSMSPAAMSWNDTLNNVKTLDMWRHAVGLHYKILDW